MPNRRTRQRQLAKLAERRAAERARKRRQRILAAVVAVALALGGGGFLLATFLGGGSPTPAASPRATPSATPAVSVACGGTVPKAASKKKPSFKKPPKDTIDAKKTYTIKMQTSCGTIEIQLDQKSAPHTVNSLVFLARQHFFDGLLFHRTVQDFVIQGGDPLTVAGNPPASFGTGGPGYKTVDPPPKGATYAQGTVAMAKAGTEANGTAGSQFFVVTGASAGSALAPGGTGQYAIVGKVTKGLDVALQIEHLPREQGAADGRPAQDVYIVKVTVEVS
ncbi:MAG TPA: peptidylprolyl isomerase [Actinomycetota bacterium]|nr:peptidylprolyl isomerase [Actinomycetota bacterium]